MTDQDHMKQTDREGDREAGRETGREAGRQGGREAGREGSTCCSLPTLPGIDTSAVK